MAKSTSLTTTDVRSDFKLQASRKAAETLSMLNPDLEIEVRKLAHFHHGYGICISTESFFTAAMKLGKGLELPDTWQIKDLPHTNNYQLLVPNEEIIFIRVTDKPSERS